MKIKIKGFIISITTRINKFISYTCGDNTPLLSRYSLTYYMYIGEGTLDKYKNKSIAYSGLVSDAPTIFQDLLIKDIELGLYDKYVIIIDNWK